MADAVTIEIGFTLEFTADPVGAELSVSVEDAITEEVRQKFLEQTQRTLVGSRGNLVFQAVQQAHDNLRSYGTTHDYHVEPIIEGFDGVEATRSSGSIKASWSWSHEAAAHFEYGTSDHSVSSSDGPLVFEFDADRYPYLDEMFPQGTAFLPETDVSGLPEGRWIRDSLNWFRREVSQA
ncbi:hypothetical protein [Halobellus rufus]|uniref:hypothetical protein n=1 Tax=Halobellus rufus TaxID=1448860 RepID=UPI000679744C|nr:hypothetical protein [Halobellus rufus]